VLPIVAGQECGDGDSAEPGHMWLMLGIRWGHNRHGKSLHLWPVEAGNERQVRSLRTLRAENPQLQGERSDSRAGAGVRGWKHEPIR